MSLILDTGWMAFNSFASEEAGTGFWENAVSNAQSEDAIYVIGSTTPPGSTTGIHNTDRLVCTNPTLPHNLIGVQIVGIEVRVLRKAVYLQADIRNLDDSAAYIVKGGTVQTLVDKNQDVAWPTTAAWATYGGSADLWGQAWTDADIGSGFGFSITGKVAFEQTAVTIKPYVDTVQVKVYFEPHGMFATL